ncbi:MAG TPA: tRNA pseudouridine(55) synthase TruB [Candidatus Peribacteraceae bacterium]|nr:tRNA pseudouridine(55) synthase TruB [Candidatus Peribacteraceae bacterium]
MRHGFLLIDKPTGPTSHDVVQMVRKTLNESKAGHLGTLDPAASGLLVVAVGAKALKVIEYFQHLTKEYEATIHFGAASSTYDREGVIEAVETKPGWIEPDLLHVRRMIEDRFLGRTSQTPPAYSAVHIDGKRAHELARSGANVTMPTRDVEIEKCEILSYDYPTLTLDVLCSSGTYIRSLAHDLGDMLRCGAYLESLRRIKVGEWSVENAISPDKVNWTDVVPLKEILRDFRAIEVSESEAADIKLGKKIPKEIKPDTLAWFDGLPIAFLVPSKDGSRTAHARKVL